jgi:hypothetical protein
MKNYFNDPSIPLPIAALLNDAQEVVSKRMVDEAIRLGDRQVNRIISLTNEVRDLKRALWHAVVLLEQGRPGDARRILEVHVDGRKL